MKEACGVGHSCIKHRRSNNEQVEHERVGMSYKPDKIDNFEGLLVIGVKEEMKPCKYIQKESKHSQYFCIDVLHSPCQQYQQEASQEWRFMLSIYSSSSPIIFLSQHLILNHLQDSNIQPTSFSTISNTSPDISSLALKTYSPNFDMQLQQLLLLGLSAGAYANTVASGVSCWQSGPVVSVSNIAPSIATICNYLQGAAYVPQEERYQCVQDAAGVMWDFSLTVSQQ